MILIPQILLFAITAYQDFKDRAISWFLPLLILLLGFAKAYGEQTINWRGYLGSFSFIVLQFLFLVVYLMVKHRTYKLKVTREFIGLGDLLFFLAIVPNFEFIEFAILLIIGLVFSLIAHLIMLRFIKSESIPLAGWLSVFYSLYFIVTY